MQVKEGFYVKKYISIDTIIKEKLTCIKKSHIKYEHWSVVPVYGNRKDGNFEVKMIDPKIIKSVYVVSRYILQPLYREICDYIHKKSLKSVEDLGEEKPIIICLLASMAKLARIDGKISKKEIENVRYFLVLACQLNSEAVKWGMDHFNRAANGNATIKYYAESYYKLVNGDFNKRYSFASLLMELSFADNEFHPKEKKAILDVIKTLRLPKSSFDKMLFHAKLNKEIPHDRIRDYGTGFVFTDDGFVITNYHNIRRAYEIKVRSENYLHNTTIIHYDKKADLALLKIDGEFKAIPYRLESPYLGQSIFTIGFPQPIHQGFLPKISKGSICGLAGSEDNINHLQIDANIHPGNSGGPLIDCEKGYLVGIVKAVLKDANKVSYAIRPEVLQNFIDCCPGLSSNLNKPRKKKKKFKYIIDDTKKSVVQIFSCKKEGNFLDDF